MSDFTNGFPTGGFAFECCSDCLKSELLTALEEPCAVSSFVDFWACTTVDVQLYVVEEILWPFRRPGHNTLDTPRVKVGHCANFMAAKHNLPFGCIISHRVVPAKWKVKGVHINVKTLKRSSLWLMLHLYCWQLSCK